MGRPCIDAGCERKLGRTFHERRMPEYHMAEAPVIALRPKRIAFALVPSHDEGAAILIDEAGPQDLSERAPFSPGKRLRFGNTGR